jgi:hypothetical protein
MNIRIPACFFWFLLPGFSLICPRHKSTQSMGVKAPPRNALVELFGPTFARCLEIHVDAGILGCIQECCIYKYVYAHC